MRSEWPNDVKVHSHRDTYIHTWTPSKSNHHFIPTINIAQNLNRTSHPFHNTPIIYTNTSFNRFIRYNSTLIFIQHYTYVELSACLTDSLTLAAIRYGSV